MRNLKGVSVSQGGKKTSKGQEESGSVKVKLPLAPVNGKRPNVELVMLQVGSLTNEKIHCTCKTVLQIRCIFFWLDWDLKVLLGN